MSRIFLWFVLLGVLVANNALNESIYPSEYLFGGPKKVLMLSTIETNNTDNVHYYYDCRCVDGLQIERAAFTKADRMAQEVTCDVRYFLAFAAIPVAFHTISLAFQCDGQCLQCTNSLATFASIFASLFLVLAAILIISAQSHTGCEMLVECPADNENAWKRSNFSVLFLVAVLAQSVFVWYVASMDMGGRTKRKGYTRLVTS